MQVIKLRTLPLRTVIFSFTLFKRQVFQLYNLSLECYMCRSTHRIRINHIDVGWAVRIIWICDTHVAIQRNTVSWVAQWIEWIAEGFKKRILRPVREASFEFWAMFRFVPAAAGYLWISLWSLSQRHSPQTCVWRHAYKHYLLQKCLRVED